MPLPPRRIVITGASAGLGRALALSYAEPGVSLGLIGRNTGRLEATAGACRAVGARAETAAIDIGEAGTLAAWLGAFDAAQPIDLLIANAGVSAGSPDGIAPEGLGAASGLVRTNLLGVVNTVETVAPWMLARSAGHIAVVASTAALRALPYMPAYCATKAGVRAYGEGLRALLAPSGVAVTVIVPGFFESEMSRRYRGPKPLMISEAAAVARVRRGLDARAARVVFPRRIALLLQLADLLPASLVDPLVRSNRFRIEPS